MENSTKHNKKNVKQIGACSYNIIGKAFMSRILWRGFFYF
jgi:hypothetical protein